MPVSNSDRVLGVGIDLCELDRIESLWKRLGDRFLRRVYNPAEIAYIQSGGTGGSAAVRCAGLFAAKEAVVKCLGTGFSCGVGWKQVEIARDRAVSPSHGWVVRLHGEAGRRADACGESEWRMDIHYSRSYAMAAALWTTRASVSPGGRLETSGELCPR